MRGVALINVVSGSGGRAGWLGEANLCDVDHTVSTGVCVGSVGGWT